jgi:outer membrane protein TolC
MKNIPFFLFAFVSVHFLQAQTQEQKAFSLKEAQEYAVQNSYFTRMATMDEEKALKKVRETTAIGLPQISGNASLQHFLAIPVQVIPNFLAGLPGMGPQPEFIEAQFGVDYNASVGLSVSQLLFDGSYIVGLQAAKTYKELAQINRLKSDVDVRDQVTKAYANVLVARENRRTINENKTLLQQTLTETQMLYKEGFVEEQDVQQLEILLNQSESQLSNADELLNTTQDLLKFVMGLPLNAEVEWTDPLESMIAYGTNSEVLTQSFSGNINLDYKLAITNERLMFLNMRNERAQYLPKLNASFNYMQNYMNTDLSFNKDRWFPNSVVGVNLNVPIFSSFMRYNRVQQAKIDLEKAQLQTEMQERQLQLDYARFKADYQFALNQYKNTKQNMTLVESIVNKELVKYNEGMSSSLNLANAQIQYVQIQGGYIQSIMRLVQSRSELDKILNNYNK